MGKNSPLIFLAYFAGCSLIRARRTRARDQRESERHLCTGISPLVTPSQHLLDKPVLTDEPFVLRASPEPASDSQDTASVQRGQSLCQPLWTLHCVHPPQLQPSGSGKPSSITRVSVARGRAGGVARASATGARHAVGKDPRKSPQGGSGLSVARRREESRRWHWKRE